MSDDEECPICHTKRYFNHKMRFLVNPDCYHQMCDVKVDRIFSHGPAPGSRARLPEDLAQEQVQTADFGDLALEREIDIRKRCQVCTYTALLPHHD